MNRALSGAYFVLPLQLVPALPQGNEAAPHDGVRAAERHRHGRPEEIIAKLRRVDVAVPHGHSLNEALRSIGVTQFSYYRLRKEFGGLKSVLVKWLKELEQENERLRKAVSDLTLEKLMRREAASGNF